MQRKWRLRSPEEESLEEPLINLTPLLDVVFVVLIAFMLIAPVLDIEHVDLAASGPASKKEPMSAQNRPLAITVRADNTIWFQGQKMQFAELEKRLREEKRRRPLETPQIIPDKQAPFGTYQEVKNILERCGFEQMEIILKPS